MNVIIQQNAWAGNPEPQKEIYTIKRFTKTLVFLTNNKTVRKFSRKNGVELPKDKWVNTWIQNLDEMNNFLNKN